MSAKKRALKVSVAPDGTITAETIGFTGSTCLSQIGALEDLLEATTVRSAFTITKIGRASCRERV